MRQMEILRSILVCLRSTESWLGDAWMNVDTAHSKSESPTHGSRHDGHRFQTNSHATIRRAIRAVQPGVGDTAVVLGSAKGRAVCHFARLPLKKVIGIEISEQLCEAAAINIARLRGRRSPVDLRNEDAAVADVSEASILYMFNPFGEETLRDVLRKLEQSHKPARRPVRIIYLNPRYSNVFNEFSWLGKILQTQRFTGIEMRVYASCY